MRTFTASVSPVTTSDQVKYMNQQRASQNTLANSGGGTTVPQFRSAGPGHSTTNSSIRSMASHHAQLDANSKYNHCVGKSASTCGGRRSRTRKRKMKKKK